MTKYELGRTGYGTDKTRDFNWNELKDMGCEMVKADVCDEAAIKDHSSGCDFIIHTAAQPAMAVVTCKQRTRPSAFLLALQTLLVRLTRCAAPVCKRRIL